MSLSAANSTLDDAEKGIGEPQYPLQLGLQSETSTIVNGTTPLPTPYSEATTIIQTPAVEKPEAQTSPTIAAAMAKAPPKKLVTKKTSRWIRFQLWFNTYRYDAL